MEYVQSVTRVRDFARIYWFDLLIAILAIAAMVQLVLTRDSARTTLWFGLPAIAVLTLPIFARRRFPFAGPLAYFVLAAGVSFIDWQLIPSLESFFVIGLAVAFLLGNLRSAWQAGIGLVVVLASLAVIVYKIPGHTTGELVFIPLDFAVSWVAGFALRERSEQAEAAEMRAAVAERERDAAARIAVAEERARIARELHDIVGHAVNVMVVHAGAGEGLATSDPTRARAAFSTIAATGRTALADLDRMLAVLQGDQPRDPLPGLDGLSELCQGFVATGLAVELKIVGDPSRVPASTALAGYRIVQEALTNVLKHAEARKATVEIEVGDVLQVSVTDDGRAGSVVAGRGLQGMTERVEIHGGVLAFGPVVEGGFRVEGRIPLDQPGRSR